MACNTRNQTSAFANIIIQGFECQRGNQSHECLITACCRKKLVPAWALNIDAGLHPDSLMSPSWTRESLSIQKEKKKRISIYLEFSLVEILFGLILIPMTQEWRSDHTGLAKKFVRATGHPNALFGQSSKSRQFSVSFPYVYIWESIKKSCNMFSLKVKWMGRISII